MKKWIIILVALVLLAAVVWGTLKGRRGKSQEVEVAEVVRKELVATVTASGTIHPARSVDISSEVMGKVVRLDVAEGDRVAEGQFLLQFDDTALAAAQRTVQADLRLASAEKAEIDLRRARELHEQELAPVERLEAAHTDARIAEARVAAARSRLDRARDDLAKARVDAPMSGIITRLNVEEGENAIMGTLNVPGTVLLTIAELSTMEARVNVDETEVVKIALGQPAEVEIDAFPDSTFTGEVTEIGNSPIYTSSGASQQAVDFQVKVTLTDQVPSIRPGLSCKTEIEVARREDALAVPLGSVTVRQWPPRESTGRRRARGSRQAAEATDSGSADVAADADVEREDKEGVFVLAAGEARFQTVELGITGEDDFEVLSGLAGGESIITGPFRVLRDLDHGDAVTAEEDDDGDGERSD